MNMLGSAFGGMNDPSGENLLPFMQHMMQSLLSKDILYPALTSIIEKVSFYFLNLNITF